MVGKFKGKDVLLAGVLASVALNFLFFVYGVCEMYFLNKADMLFGITQVLKVVVPMFLIGTLLASLVLFVMWLINEKLYLVGLDRKSVV